MISFRFYFELVDILRHFHSNNYAHYLLQLFYSNDTEIFEIVYLSSYLIICCWVWKTQKLMSESTITNKQTILQQVHFHSLQFIQNSTDICENVFWVSFGGNLKRKIIGYFVEYEFLIFDSNINSKFIVYILTINSV